MVQSDVILILLSLLFFSVTLNLVLTIKLQRKLITLNELVNPKLEVPIGTVIPNSSGRVLATNANWQMHAVSRPKALIFLSTRCPKCEHKLAQIDSMIAKAELQGLEIKLISYESGKRLRRFMKGNSLLANTVLVRRKSYRALNPKEMTPYYMFLDEEHIVQATGEVGDDNWLSLVNQLNEQPGPLENVA